MAARRFAMDCLARREYGVQELTGRLQAKGYADGLVAGVVEQLVADRLLSDDRFTEAFVNARIRRGSGPHKIRAELRGRGIDDHLIDAGLRAHTGDWPDLARSVRERKYGADVPADYRERTRQMRFLQQRGFSTEQINAAFGDE